MAFGRCNDFGVNDRSLEPTLLRIHDPWDPLQWRHNGCDSVSNHQPHDCLLNRLFRRTSKKTSKLRVTGLCVGNSAGTGESVPAQMASNAENVSIWWRHHAMAFGQCNNFRSVIYIYFICTRFISGSSLVQVVVWCLLSAELLSQLLLLT